MSQSLSLVCRTLLFIALLPTGLMTVLVFATGIWFSPVEHPLALVLALALASGPLWVVRAIMLSADEEGGKRVAVQTAAIWTAIAIYALFVSETLPSFVYEGFHWLVA